MRQSKITTLERRVRKHEPDAELKTDADGGYFIGCGIRNLMEEQMIPHASSEREAWTNMWECLRTQKNIRRSSPLKAIFYKKDETKKARISNRIRGRKQKKK